MAGIVLCATTGNGVVDQVVRETVGIFETVFAGRVVGYYVEGSYADATGIPTSDVDLTVVFRDRLQDEAEQDRARQTGADCGQLSAVELDIEVTDETTLAAGVWPPLQDAGLLVYGTDIRAGRLVLPLDRWTRDRMHTSYWRLVRLFERPPVVRPPLDYPDPADEFFGYLRRLVRLPDGTLSPGTRDLIRATGWAATAIIAYQTGQYVTRKKDCHRLYRTTGDDAGAVLLADIYEQCRNRWQYQIPDAPEDRARLRAICARTLAFERHFLTVYKEFALKELAGADPAGRGDAARVLGEIPFADGEIQAALARVSE